MGLGIILRHILQAGSKSLYLLGQERGHSTAELFETSPACWESIPLWARRAKFSCVLQAGSVPRAQDLPSPIPQLWTSQNLPHLGKFRVQILNKAQNRGRREEQSCCHLSLSLPGMLCLILQEISWSPFLPTQPPNVIPPLFSFDRRKFGWVFTSADFFFFCSFFLFCLNSF